MASGSEGAPFSWQPQLSCATRPRPWWKELLSPRAPVWEVLYLLCPVWPHTGDSSLGSSLLRPAMLFPERWSVFLLNSGGSPGLVFQPDSPPAICFLHCLSPRFYWIIVGMFLASGFWAGIGPVSGWPWKHLSRIQSSQDTVCVCVWWGAQPVFCTDIISCDASVGMWTKVIYAHFTDEKAEAQGTDMTYPSLRTGIQKYTSPKTASGFPKMSEIISLPLRGQCPTFELPVWWEGPMNN